MHSPPCGVPAAFVNSSLSVAERRQVAQRVSSGELKMLFAAPGKTGSAIDHPISSANQDQLHRH